MATLDHMKINLEGIGHALGDRYLRVPLYQRSYAWEEQNVLDLIDDLRNAFTKNEKEYFLGAVVISETEEVISEVVDGQQRLATTTILIAAIRNYFQDHGESDRAADIERDFLLSRDRRSQELRARLTLSSADHDFFLRRILQRETEKIPIRPSHERLLAAAKIAERRVASIAKSVSTPTDHLLRWLDYLEENARIIWVQVPGHANAFVVFETLNDRGLGLSAADLLKNYLFSLAGDRLDEAQDLWTRMLGSLEALADEETVVDYIRHYWSSTSKPSRKRELYFTIKTATTSKQAAIALGAELQAHAHLYAALLNPNHTHWVGVGGTAKEHVATLQLLRMEQNRPLLLAGLRHFSVPEVRKTLRLIVSWSARFLVVGGLGGGTMERHYSDRANEVRSGEITTAEELARAMAGVVPTDAQFRSSFSTVRVSQTWLARYYLRALEKTALGEKEPELIPNPNEEQVNLEHVLPQSPEGNWPDVEPEVARAYYKRLGNLALQRKGDNSLSGNAPFDDKKPYIQKSRYKLTQSIANKDQWGPTQIDERQEELSELAVNTWPI
ncbi:MAG: DUF262 domain-containing protein [bacterium]|nr:DUF262 domain-containing protein [bacterium]